MCGDCTFRFPALSPRHGTNTLHNECLYCGSGSIASGRRARLVADRNGLRTGRERARRYRVAKIYAAKNRPSFNPLIVHVPDVATARQYAQFNDLAERVAETLWPGPLSIVLPRTEASALSKLVSAGLDTVAVRIPASPHARRLFAVAELPVAAPSANKSNRLSPTEARHVANNFGEEVSLVLDGGPCTVGLEFHRPRSFNGHANAAPRRRHGPRRFGSRDRATLVRAGTDDHSPKSPGMLSRHITRREPLCG